MKNLFNVHFCIEASVRKLTKLFRLSIPAILIAFLISSCSKKNFPDAFFEGEIIIRAEKYYPLGLIKVNGVFGRDTIIEIPSRAIIYRKESITSFDLERNVWFKIKEEDGFQLAKDVTQVKPISGLATRHDIYEALRKMQFNLHNADNHREGPRHTKRHIITSSPSLQYPGYSEVDTEEYGTGMPMGIVFVRDEDVPDDQEEPYFFGVICYSVCISSPDGPDLYEIIPTHEHTH